MIIDCNNKKSIRGAIGEELAALGEKNKNIVVLDADLSGSTKTSIFAKKFPERFFNTGIAEQNMIALASGLASEGRNVFASSFASFATTRCYEQVKVNLGYMQHNVKLVGIASGLGVSHQGNTHFGLDDVSLMRAIPNMTIIVPSDCTEVAKATIALAEFEGPAYLRLVGEGFVPIVNDDDYEFEIGKGIEKRDRKDILMIANGTMVSQSLKAAKELSEQNGIEATVINMHTVKPLDTQIISDHLNGKKLIVTIEEGQVNGGLGSAVAEYVASVGNAPRMLRLGVNDIFPHAGSYNYLLEQCGLDVETIKNKIINSIR